MFCQIKTGVDNPMESTEQNNRDIDALQKAVKSENWAEVNTLLSKDHCMKSFTQIILKNRSDYAYIYILIQL